MVLRADVSDQTRELVIDPDLESLCPPLTTEELATLRESIAADGCRDAITVWATGDTETIVDGHNRYRICQELCQSFRVRVLAFADKDAAKIWMCRNQLGRRNLSPEQASYLRGEAYRLAKNTHGGERDGAGRPGGNSSAQNAHLNNNSGNIAISAPTEGILAAAANNQNATSTAAQVAANAGVDPATVRRDEKFAAAVDSLADPALRVAVLAGTSGLTRGEIQRIGKLPAAQQAEALKVLLAEKAAKKAAKGSKPAGSKPTPTASVEAAADAPPTAAPPGKPVLDAIGGAVPTRLVPAFTDGTEKMKKLYLAVLAICRECEALQNDPVLGSIPFSRCAHDLRRQAQTLRLDQPHVVCGACRGKGAVKGTECPACHASGWLHKRQWDAVPQETRREWEAAAAPF